MSKDEALKLASALDHWATQMDMGRKPDPKSLIRKASAELRRLQAELDATKQALAAQPALVQDLPFGVGGGLVAIKTLLSRDPCVHANTAIEMIDAILKEHPAAQRQWVGLTDEEMYLNCPNWLSQEQCKVWIQQIEAKLKEKNT